MRNLWYKPVFKTLIIALGFIILTSSTELNNGELKFEKVIHEHYELYKPLTKINGVLVLFGGYPEKAKDIQNEFNIRDIAIKNEVAVIFTNLNQKLWLEENEKVKFSEIIQTAFTSNKLPIDNIYFGGFSSGGNVALILSEHLISEKKSIFKPKGVFIVDSPIDLEALYNTSLENIQRNVSETSVQESNWIIHTLKTRFDKPSNNIADYQSYSIYNQRTSYIKHFDSFKNLKLRFYTEPDLQWWSDNRKSEYHNLNAFYIKELSEELIELDYKIEHIETSNKGYRANGDRHPHSWSIVDKPDLINWILEEQL